MAEVMNLKKRLIGKEDINFDVTGTGETENFFSQEGVQYSLTKLNASHVPLTAATREKTASANIDIALMNLADKIENFSAADVLPEDTTITFEAEDTIEVIQDKINLQKKNLNGHTLTFLFPISLQQNLYSTLEFNDFVGGTVVIAGGTDENKISIYDQLDITSFFRFYRCQCEIIVQYFYFVHQYSLYAISVESSSAVIIKDCIFSGMENVDSYAVNRSASNTVLVDCDLNDDIEFYPEEDASGVGKHIGEIFAYPSSRPPEGAFLLNGQTIYNCSTLYPEFWEWLNTEATSGYVRSITATEYESEIAQYGFCGAFVISDTSVRLPNYADAFIMGGNSSNIGTEVEAGLPNITGTESVYVRYNSASGAFVLDPSSSGIKNADGSTFTASNNLTFDASRCSSIYGKSTTVQPPAIRTIWCIQVYNVATELSTQESAQLASEMQLRAQEIVELRTQEIAPLWGEIAQLRTQEIAPLWSAMGGKAQTDLSNVNPVQAFKNMSISWGMPDYSAGVYKAKDILYTAECDGVLIFVSEKNGSVVWSLTLTINTVEVQYFYCEEAANAFSFCVPVNRGDTYITTCGINAKRYVFYPLKGAN